MPVTAKLSRKFYDKLGDEVANELVDWFNTVDLTYRSEMRELFETHFLRFEARLGQRTAELGAELRLEFRQGLAEVRAEHRADFAALRQELADQKAAMHRLLLYHGVGTVIATLGGLLAIRQLLP